MAENGQPQQVDGHIWKAPTWRFEREFTRLGLACVLLLHLGLCICYALSITVHVDEFASAYAARVTLERGMPLLPSGYFYTHGLTFSYLAAPFLALARLVPSHAEFLWRLPSVIISLITCLLLYRVGERLFSPTVGLIAALALTVCPDVIEWGGRARMYALLQLWSTLAMYSLYRATQSERSRWLWLFPVFFAAAMLTHLESALLLPALVVAVVALRKVRWLFRPRTLVSFALCGVGVAIPLVIEALAPVQLESEESGILSVHGGLSRYLGGFDSTRLVSFREYFTDSPRSYLAILFAVALVFMAYALARRRGAARTQLDKQARAVMQPLIFFTTTFVVTLLEFLLVVQWHVSDRYLFFVLPALILPASWAMWQVILLVAQAIQAVARALGTHAHPGRGNYWLARGMVLFSAVASPLLLATVLDSWSDVTAPTDDPDYVDAFRLVARRKQEDDIVLSSSVGSLLYLDELDYFFLDRRYDLAVVQEDSGEQVHVLTGAPRLQSTEALAQVLDGESRVWAVVDGRQLDSRYFPETRALLQETMQLAWTGPYISVYVSQRPYDEIAGILSRKADPDQDAIVTSRPSLFEAKYDGPLPIYVVEPESTQEQVRALQQELAGQYGRVWYVRWKDPESWAPLSWLDYYWQTNAFERYRRTFPDGDLYLYELADEPEDTGASSISMEPAWSVEDALRLDQLTITSDTAVWGRDVGIELDWTVLSQPDRYLAQFVHVVDDTGQRWGQGNAWLEDEQFASSTYWEAGQQVHQDMAVELQPGTSPGAYRLVYGIYDRLGGEAAAVRDSQGNGLGDGIEIGTLKVTTAPYQPLLGRDIDLAHQLDLQLTPSLTLLGLAQVPEATFGQPLVIAMLWRADESPALDYGLQLSLVSENGDVLAQDVFALGKDDYPTSQWKPGEIIWRYYSLPVGDQVQVGTAELRLTLLDSDERAVDSAVSVAQVGIDGHRFDTPSIAHPQEAQLGQGIRFLGYYVEDTAAAGEDLNLILYWQCTQPIAASNKVFVHMLDESGVLVAQDDDFPLNRRYPTNEWLEGEVIIDRYAIDLPDDASPGEYQLEIGMYDPEQPEVRLPLFADGVRQQDDRLLLDSPVQIEAEE